MKINKLYSILIAICLGFAISSCNDWLDVTPQAQVSSEKIFDSPEGFQSVLYGIYISMTESNSYGQNQSFGFMDVLAQYYTTFTNQSHILYQASLYNYTNGTIRDLTTNMWLNNYNTIANCNILLENLEKKDISYFTRNHYNLLKGEALAIRAYVHFDLLRAFALNYLDYPDAMGIPYASSFTHKVHPQLKTKEVLSEIIRDLNEAQELLKEIDPVLLENFKDPIFHFAQPQRNKDIFESYRAYRMNYYAVKALLARIYYYMGDEKEAYSYASEIIAIANDGNFTFTDEYALAADLKNRDIIMQNELIFALDGLDVKQLFYRADASTNSNFPLLEPKTLYPDADDFRHYIIGESTSNGRVISYKYVKTNTSSTSNQGKIPMIRLSELYLIAASSVFKTNKDEATEYLKTIRKLRGASQIVNNGNYEDFLGDLTFEARREFLGEGQLFYWYKRHNMPILRQGAEITLTPEQSCLPMPSNEVEFGNRIEDYLKH